MRGSAGLWNAEDGLRLRLVVEAQDVAGLDAGRFGSPRWSAAAGSLGVHLLSAPDCADCADWTGWMEGWGLGWFLTLRG